MMSYVVAWIAAAIVFAIADAIWLSQAGPRLYRPMIGEIMSERVALAPAALFYLIYVTGIVVLAVAPALEKDSLRHAVLAAAALGFVAYATYDLSNQATLKAWNTRLTLIDIAWGTFASAVTGGAAYWAAQRFG